MDDTLFWSLAFVLAVLFALRVFFRFRNHVAAQQEAKRIGIIHCKKCGFHGPLLGWATFFGIKRLVCPKCRSADWVRSSSRG